MKTTDKQQLCALAQSLRDQIIAAVEQNGGHLASALGAVELCVALYQTLDFGVDHLVFDVGHQCYAYKLLTGRSLERLRREDGVSGFPTRLEGDDFGTGHAGTAISAALGLARADRILGRQSLSVAVVGDGALTNGQCYEALNDAGSAKIPMLVIINDNRMSIARNVGAMSQYLTKICRHKPYLRLKAGVKRVLRHAPGTYRRVDRFKRAVKQLVVPSGLFEDLGFAYAGPVDGHNIADLMEMIAFCRSLGRPAVLHVITKKGQGDPQAQAQPSRYHNVSVHDEPDEPGMQAASAGMGQHLCQMAMDDARICAITAAMPANTGLSSFAKAFPDRFFDVGIAEGHAVTMAAAMAAQGMKPFVPIYATFLQRAYDQIVHDVALQRLPVVILSDKSGFVGADGATHQGLYDGSFLHHIPNLTVYMPRDMNQLCQAMESASALDAPVVIRYGRQLPALIEGPDCPWPQWPVLRAGSDVVLFACGAMADSALGAAALLALEGVDAAVVDARTLKPLDEKMLDRMLHLPAVTVEEGAIEGGLGRAIQAWRCERGGAPTAVLGAADRVFYHAARARQLHMAGLTPQQICAYAHKVMGRFDGILENKA